MSTCPYCASAVTFTTTTLDEHGSWTVYQPCGHPAPPSGGQSYADFLADQRVHESVLAEMQSQREERARA